MAKKSELSTTSAPVKSAPSPEAITRRNALLMRALPVAGLVLLWAIFYGKLLTGQAFLWEDIREQLYPTLTHTVYCLKHGWFPLWTPYVFGGMPFASDVLATLFYPPQWLLIGASMVSEPGGVSLTWYLLLHILLLGIGMYLLARDFEMGKIAAFLVGVGMMFTGYLSLHVIHCTLLYVLSWFPLIFMFLRRAYRTGKIADLAVAALLYGVSTLGGYPQPTLHFAYFFMFWTAYEVALRWKTDKRAVVRLGLYFGIFMGIGLAIAAIQYLPSIAHQAQSVRETMTFEESSKGSISPSRLITLFVPKFFGWMTGDAGQGSPYWAYEGQSYLFWDANIFVAIVPLFLMMGILLDIKRNKTAMFFAGLGVVTLLLALGSNTPLYYLVWNFAPGFQSFRIPGRFTFWVSFSIIMLAGFGLDALLKERDEAREKKLLVASGILAGLIGVPCLLFLVGAFRDASPYFENKLVLSTAQQATGVALFVSLVALGGVWLLVRSQKRPVVATALVLVAFAELFAFGSAFGNGTMNPANYFRRFGLPGIKKELAQENFRVQSRLYRGENRGEMLLPRNLGNVIQVPLTEGYNQLMLRRYNELLYKVDEQKGGQLLSVRYKKVAGKNTVDRLAHVPWFYVTPNYRVFDSQDALVAYVNSPEFVPGKNVALESKPSLDMVPVDSNAATVAMRSWTPNRIEVEVTTPANALLSSSDIYYPAWKARVDGAPAQLLPANLAFRAVAVPAGKHTVVMYFAFDEFAKGAAISIAALVCALALLLLGRTRLPLVGRPWLGL